MEFRDHTGAIVSVGFSNPFPIGLLADAQEGQLASVTVTLGAVVTVLALPDWAQGFILTPATNSVRFAVNEDPAADGTASGTPLASTVFAVGATAPADTQTVRLLLIGAGRTLHLLGTDAATVAIEVF